MAHTYATVAEANDYITSAGSTKFASESAAIVALKLSILESVSRRIDEVCHRSAFGSGFGPRIGTNLYDGDGSNELLLRDDLLSTSAFTVASVTAGTGVTVTVSTDYYLANPDGYTGAPWRKVILHGKGSTVQFGAGYRTVSLAGTFGHQDVTLPTGTTVSSGLSVGTTATSFTTSASPAISPGNTLLIGTEQVYLYVLSGTTATIVRGANGSTAATHADTSAISKYSYDSRVHDVCLRLFLRRWKSRDAGADGMDGGLEIAGQPTREGERLIIERGLSGLIKVGIF